MDKASFQLPSIIDSVSDETSSSQFVSLKGAENISEMQFTANSGAGTNTLTFSINVPSTGVVLDSCIIFECDV